jgi:hypothetical protein
MHHDRVECTMRNGEEHVTRHTTSSLVMHNLLLQASRHYLQSPLPRDSDVLKAILCLETGLKLYASTPSDQLECLVQLASVLLNYTTNYAQALGHLQKAVRYSSVG